MHMFSRWIILPLFLAVPVLRAAEPPAPAARLIEHFKMEKIPDEGCWFTQTYRSLETIPGKDLPARYAETDHSTGTAIYALETREGFSALHVLNTDEVYHWYDGSAMEMLLLYPDGHGETLVLGPDVFKGERPQIVIPHSVWQGSRPVEAAGPEAYTFFGTTVSPGFEYGDFRMGDRAELLKSFPSFTTQIANLTRDAKSQQTTQQPQSTDPLLDVSDYERAKAAIDDAVKARRYDLLFRAIHNKSDEMRMFCLDDIRKIPKASQAELLSKVLRDKSILRRSELVYAGGSEDEIAQSMLQIKLQEIAYDVLQQKRPIKQVYLSTQEALTLAGELDKLK